MAPSPHLSYYFPDAGAALALGCDHETVPCINTCRPRHYCRRAARHRQSRRANAAAQTPPAVEKLNAYVGCINRLSARSYDSRARYFSWAAKSGPTGRERIIYGTYTIYDTSDCRKNVEKANALEPRDAALEAAATAYAEAVGKLEPLLKEADDYYSQQDYKDDKMAKGKALHPRLVAAWDAFASADKTLRSDVDAINDKRALEKLAAIEQSEGRKARYHVEALMIQAKRVLRAQDAAKPDVAAITQALERLRRDRQRRRAIFAAPAAAPRSARSSSATPSRFWSRRSN